MSLENSSIDVRNLCIRDYDFPLEKVNVFHWDTDLAQIIEHIRNKTPVVIKGSNIVRSALKWNLDYLKENLGNSKHVVWLSKTNRFKYWNDTIAKQIEDKIPFVPPTKSVQMTVQEFSSRIESWKRGKDYVYMQQQLNDTVGPSMFEDFKRIEWNKLELMQSAGDWGPLTTNLLLVSQKGSITPVHYDEQENLFAQIGNEKRFLLFPPEAITNLYPHPVLHPHDRQSQVDLEDPDYDRFPRVRDLRGFETVVGPGDVLYIPNCWWHQVESLADMTVSVTFWYKTSQVRSIVYPLSASQKLTIMRNVEKMIGDALRDPAEIEPFMQTMVLGRYFDMSKK